MGFVVFFKLDFHKTPGCFFSLSKYINREADYGRFIDFVSQISKLSCFDVHDLADFMMHH